MPDTFPLHFIETRFWAKVEKSGQGQCWLWKASVNGGGYGQIWESLPSRKRWDTHRFSWVLHNGPIPEGLHVLHTCDVKRCVNPNHLYLGSNSQNTQDAIARGQKPRGADCSFAKLSHEQVIQVRKRSQSERISQDALAKEYGVSQTTIWRAVNGHAYKTTSPLR